MRILFIIFSLLSQFGYSETTIVVPGLSKPKTETFTKNVPLTVDHFLDPLTDQNRRNRPTSWPTKLTFSPPMNITADEFKAAIQGERRMVYHCDGKPVEATYLASLPVYDGYIQPSAVIGINGNRHTRKTFPPGKRYLTAPIIDNACDVEIVRKQNSSNEFEFKNSNCTNYQWTTDSAVLRRVNETGETVLETMTSGMKCKDGQPVKALYTPTDPLISSL